MSGAGDSMRILITGASGFVGRALCEAALAHGYEVRGVFRGSAGFQAGMECVAVGTIDGQTDWQAALRGIDVVIHLAARVHIKHKSAADPMEAFREVNVAGTENLAQQASRARVKRLVYVSSIGVNGLSSKGEARFTEQDVAAPHSDYAVSKWEAELTLQAVAEKCGLEIVVIRPPLVYGPGAPGNFHSLMKAVALCMPLPLASVHNLRDLIYVGNLVDALLVSAAHRNAAGETYLVCDGEAVSTPDLIRRLAVAMGVRPRLFRFPVSWLQLAGWLAGRSAQVRQLTGSLQVDDGKIRRELDWTPPYTLQHGLQVTTARSRNSHS